jgi:ribulose bisphosphate carboxylase small subunit
MLKQFYEKALPSQGVYCVGELDRSKPKGEDWKNHFARTFDEALNKIEAVKARHHDAYIAMGTFDGFSRQAKGCVYFSSLFIDLDVGEDKPYTTKEHALETLDKFVTEQELPPPNRVDSGNGIHAYWLFGEDIPAQEFLPYAKLWKKLCMKNFTIDPLATPANLAQVMRWADSTNYRYDPPSQTKFLDDEVYEYDFGMFKEFLGEPEAETDNVLAGISKGLDEDTRAMLKLDNFSKSFDALAEKSLNGVGCNQIANILTNAATLEEPLWWAGLSIAKFCDDGATAIHKMSEDHPEYNYDDTEEKASRLPAPRTCEWFLDNYPKHCEGCAHRGKITTPIVLGKEFKPAPATNQEDSVWQDSDSKTIPHFPEYLFPFLRGANGGIYYQPPAKYNKQGEKIEQDPILVLPHEFFPVRRMFSKHDGECLLMRLELPRDPVREILVPMKNVYAQDQFKALMSSNGVFASAEKLPHLMNYVIKWGQYMQLTDKAEMMRMQMGWTEDMADPNWSNRSFVIGKKEITHTGEIIEAPASPFVRGIAKHLIPQGTYARWRESSDHLNQPGFEMHAFTMLCGMASPFMTYTSTAGVTVCLLGKSGSAKTGAMYAGLSVWGHPKELSVFEATDNGMTGRYLGLHNIPLGVDEISNKDAKVLSQLVHKISHGKAKIRMQGSVNAEREHEMSASLVGIMTTNQSAYSKFEGIKANPDGEAARLIEFLIHKPPLLEDNGALGKHIFDAFRFNYGHAGPMLIQEALRLGDNYILDNISMWDERFTKDFGDDTTYRFYQNLMSATCMAGTMANNANIIDLDISRVYHETVREMITIRDKVVKVNRTDYPSILGDYVNKNLGNILVLKDGKVAMEPRGQIVGRIVSEENLMQISKTDFKKYLAERQISSREFEFEMREKKLLIDDKKGRLTTGWKAAVHVDPAYLYWFKTELPDDFFNDPHSGN